VIDTLLTLTKESLLEEGGKASLRYHDSWGHITCGRVKGEEKEPLEWQLTL
jgi:hypothetical protein